MTADLDVLRATADQQLVAAYTAGLNGEEFDMLAAKEAIALAAAPAPALASGRTTLNQWFESLPKGRQEVLLADKWMLADAAFAAALAAEAPKAELGDETVDDLWRELVEKDDRTLPEDDRDMALITREELADFLRRATPQPAPVVDAGRVDEAIMAVIDKHQYALERVPAGWNAFVKLRKDMEAALAALAKEDPAR